MGKISNSVLAHYSGRIGKFVIYQRLGKTCIRTLPACRSPVSTALLSQQERIASIAIFYKAIGAAGLKDSWQKAEKPRGWSGYNLFVQQNMPAFTSEGEIGDFDKLQLTAGSLQLPDEITLRSVPNGEWILEWSNRTLYPPGEDDDRMQIALMRCRDRFDVGIPDIGDFRRKDGKAVFRIPEEYKNFAHLFCFFCSEADGRMSRSKNIINFNDFNHGNH